MKEGVIVTQQKSGCGKEWKRVYLFISSTFNDMHAERDYLTKSVFPELREWCAKRMLEFVDIDLRWGITDEESTQSRRTLEICLENVERCRPLFLGLLGQRRGWVPRREDVAESTLQRYPELEKEIGHKSITELEIWKATHDDKIRGVFCLRDEAALADMPRDPEYQLNYRNEVFFPELGRTVTDWEQEESHEKFRQWVRTQTRYPVLTYTAHWDAALPMPEMKNITVGGKLFPRLETGRLAGFTCKGKSWSKVLLEELKKQIAAAFPEYTEQPALRGLEGELQTQERHLQRKIDNYMEIPGQYDRIEQEIASRQDVYIFALCAAAGSGKSAYMANFIRRQTGRVYYRFCGIGDESASERNLLYSLAEQWHRDGLVAELPQRSQLPDAFPMLFCEAAAHGSMTVVIDGLDELDRGEASLNWCRWARYTRGGGSSLLLSVKRGTGAARRLSKFQTLTDLTILDSLQARRDLVEQQLQRGLKKLEPEQLTELCSAPQADNPLFLTEILYELSLHGNRSTLSARLHELAQLDAAGVAGKIFDRLENDPAYLEVPQKDFLRTMFGLLADARYGLTEEELVDILLGLKKGESKSAVQDAIRHYVRQLRPFLIWRGNRLNFLYATWHDLCRRRYGGRYHWPLAYRFFTSCQQQDSGPYLGQDPLPFREYSYHAIQSGQPGPSQKIPVILAASYYWVQAKLKLCGTRALLEEVENGPEEVRKSGLAAFYRSCEPLLDADPDALPQILGTHLDRTAKEDALLSKLFRSCASGAEKMGKRPMVVPNVQLYHSARTGWAGQWRLPAALGKITRMESAGPFLLLENDTGERPVVDKKSGDWLGTLPAGARWWPEQNCFYAWEPRRGAFCTYNSVNLQTGAFSHFTEAKLPRSGMPVCTCGNMLYFLAHFDGEQDICLCGVEVCVSPAGQTKSADLRCRVMLRPGLEGVWITADKQGCALLCLYGSNLVLSYLDWETRSISHFTLATEEERFGETLRKAMDLPGDPAGQAMHIGPDGPELLLCGKTVWLTLPAAPGTDEQPERSEEQQSGERRRHSHRLYRIDLTKPQTFVQEPMRYASALRLRDGRLYAYENFAMEAVTKIGDAKTVDLAYYTARNCYDPVTGQELEQETVSPLLCRSCPELSAELEFLPGAKELKVMGRDTACRQEVTTLYGHTPVWTCDEEFLFRLRQNGCVEYYDLKALIHCGRSGAGLADLYVDKQGQWQKVWIPADMTLYGQNGAPYLEKGGGYVVGPLDAWNRMSIGSKGDFTWKREWTDTRMFLFRRRPLLRYSEGNKDHLQFIEEIRPNYTQIHVQAQTTQDIVEIGGYTNTYADGRREYVPLYQIRENSRFRLRQVLESPRYTWLITSARDNCLLHHPLSEVQKMDQSGRIWVKLCQGPALEEVKWPKERTQMLSQMIRGGYRTGFAVAIKGEDLYIGLSGLHAIDGKDPGSLILCVHPQADPEILWQTGDWVEQTSLAWDDDLLYITRPGTNGRSVVAYGCRLTEERRLLPGIHATLPEGFSRIRAARRGVLLLVADDDAGLALFRMRDRKLVWQLKFDAVIQDVSWPCDDGIRLQYLLNGQHACRLSFIQAKAIWED